MSPLRWTCKSTRNLADELRRKGFKVSHMTVAKELHLLGYSLHVLRKNHEEDHPDRNAQFEHINSMVKNFQARNQPVISVDTKKKELVGNFKNSGSEWQPTGQPEEALLRDLDVCPQAVGGSSQSLERASQAPGACARPLCGSSHALGRASRVRAAR
jgi:hypothetical protein